MSEDLILYHLEESPSGLPYLEITQEEIHLKLFERFIDLIDYHDSLEGVLLRVSSVPLSEIDLLCCGLELSCSRLKRVTAGVYGDIGGQMVLKKIVYGGKYV